MISLALIRVFQIVNLLIFVRVIISWLPIDKHNPIVGFLYQITEPILAPVRNLIQRSSVGGGMMIDFSPIVVLLLINYIIIPLLVRLSF